MVNFNYSENMIAKNINKPISTRAFTLLELAVVLVVISVILSTAISVASTRIEAQRLANTYGRIELISKAIKQYIQNYDRLPCPAFGSISAPTPAAPSPAGFGIEERLTTGTEQCDNSNLDTDGNVFIGSIPHASLGLSLAAGLDGWENRFTYAVDNRFTYSGTEALKIGYLGEENEPEIIIHNNDSAEITVTGIYLILSHGTNGVGAWPARGGSRIAAPSGFATDYPLENKNQDLDDTFVQVSHITGFDDIIFYKNKWQIEEDE